MTFNWVSKLSALGLHYLVLQQDGGLAGIRDEGALEAALARPENKYAYGENDLIVLASAYAFGIAKGHPFNDGNKRVALLVTLTFLRDNGYRLDAKPVELITAVFKLAASDLSEEGFTEFLRANIIPSK